MLLLHLHSDHGETYSKLPLSLFSLATNITMQSMKDKPGGSSGLNINNFLISQAVLTLMLVVANFTNKTNDAKT